MSFSVSLGALAWGVPSQAVSLDAHLLSRKRDIEPCDETSLVMDSVLVYQSRDLGLAKETIELRLEKAFPRGKRWVSLLQEFAEYPASVLT